MNNCQIGRVTDSPLSGFKEPGQAFDLTSRLNALRQQVSQQAALINEQAQEIASLKAQLTAMESRAIEAEQRDSLRAECLERIQGCIAETNGAIGESAGRRG